MQARVMQAGQARKTSRMRAGMHTHRGGDLGVHKGLNYRPHHQPLAQRIEAGHVLQQV